MEATISSSQEAIELENKYGAHNYHPLPVVLNKGEGVFLWDVEGKRYYDFLSAYSAVNQGHGHPRIINALIDQAKELTLTSRAFYNDKLGAAEKYVCETFGYDKALFMNSGAEANESAIKLARKWGYLKKGIPDNEAIIVAVKKNFHGRTTTIISASTDPQARNNFGPFMPGFQIVAYDDVSALQQALSNPNVCGLWIEPIQGEAGVYVPKEGYLKSAADLCKKHNVLLMMDEIQTGIARTGKMLASDHEGVRPDLLILGKALSGGVLPISLVLADDKIMLLLKPGEHGSTFGGNPLAAAVVVAALEVVKDEKLAANAERLGVIFRERMNAIKKKSDIITLVRGKGLLNAILINDSPESETAWNLCLKFAEKGLLAKPTHGNIIRLAPPLVITEEQIHECCDIIESCLLAFKK
ncbi:MAG: ornithine--oxo-acid transaminase [Cyclobacteriaceae bacterium]|jgi:ornithine--oxo-acid transaminase|nr:ornithine--oxo-acid transaminase [Cyclobacteriaceae bacterium]